jgi:transposase
LIDGIVKEDQGKSKKQQHTAHQIWEWLSGEHGFTGGYTIVKDYLREARRRTASASTSGPSRVAFGPDAFMTEDPAALTYELLQSVPKREAIRLLRLMFGGSPPQVDMERLNRLLEPFAIKETRGARRLRARQAAFDWMRKVLQGEVSLHALAGELGEVPDLNALVTVVNEGRLSDRNRALAVLAREKGFSITDVCGFLDLSKASVLKYCRRYHEGGAALLMAGKIVAATKFDKECNKQAVFSLLHAPPSAYGVNRTTWRMADLQEVLRRQGLPLCKDVIRTIFKEAGYKWRSARVVLTSRDPEYRPKVEAIKKLLSELAQDEAFFSIDEYGPFAVKKKGGVKRVPPGQEYVVPQWQKSKGWMILTVPPQLEMERAFLR